MRGRKPRPPALKILADERPDRVNGDAPTPPSGRPAAPETLDEVGRKEWERIVPQLEAMGVLSEVDGAALALYCDAFATWVEATKQIRKIGMLVKAGSGGVKPSPYVSIAREASSTMTKLLVEFGATPSSRSRVRVPDRGDKDSLGEFLNTRKAR